LINNVPLERIIDNLKNIYDRLMNAINDKKTSYQSKVLCIRVIGLIGEKLKLVAEFIIGYYQSEIIFTLENACKDRIHKVQVAANDALKTWRDLEKTYSDLEKKKTQMIRKFS